MSRLQDFQWRTQNRRSIKVTQTYANDLKKKIWIFAFDGDYLMDEHHLSFGYQLKRSDLFNLFLQNTKGSYEFASLADFEARRAKINYKNANR